MATPGTFALDEYLAETARTIEASIADAGFRRAIAAAAELCLEALGRGGKILLAGNGGSAADAQHIAGELVSRFLVERPGLPAIALTTDSSVLTAIGNDYGFEHVFSRQVEALGQPGDVLIAISTSGRSRNVVGAIEAARAKAMRVVTMVGAAGATMAGMADVAIVAACPQTPFVQQVHIIAGHALCAAIEGALTERPGPA